MYRNYVRTALRNLLKHKLFSAINIIGLSCGISACLLIALFVQSESSYDKHWSNADRLYRLNTTLDVSGDNPRRTGGSSLLALGALKNDFSAEIAHASRVRAQGREVFIGEQRYEDVVVDVDADIAAMLDFEVLDGDLARTLSDPASIALSAAVAERYFGSVNAVGQELEIVRSVSQTQTSRERLRVGAVYRVPGRSVLELPALTMLNEASFDAFTFNNWVTLDLATYVQLHHDVDVQALSARLRAFTNRHVSLPQLNLAPDVLPADRVQFDLQPLAAVYLDDTVQDGVSGGDRTLVLAFTAIAALVLLIACINFTVLSTARATQRAREVALRKTVGADRGQLAVQFLGESCLVVIPAVLLALMLAELMLPFFETLVNRDLAVDYAAPGTWMSLLLLAAAVGVGGGLYPALVLSWFRPASTLKGPLRNGRQAVLDLRSALVVFQFGTAIALIIATAVITLQVEYSARRDPGFVRENMLVLDNLNRRPDVSALKSTLKQELAALAGVEVVSLSGHQPTQTTGYVTLTLPHTLEGGNGAAQTLATMSVDYDFFDAYRIGFLAGRNYDPARDRPTPLFQGGYQSPSGHSDSSVVINASAARQLGFDAPEAALGRRLVDTRGFNAALHHFTIIGVVADTQFFSLRSAPRPEVYVLSPQFMTDVLSLRYTGTGQAVLAAVTEVWRRVVGDADLSFAFVDQLLEEEFAQERMEARMLVSFSLLAVLIACLGLYGSAAYAVERRTREIGVRKVMGAEVRELVALLLWQFSRPVLAANLLAWPVALWAMLKWLQRFPYQIDSVVLILLCVLSGALVLSVAWLTVVGNTLRVATASPLLALRYE